MKLPDHLIAEVRARVQILDVVGKAVALKPAGGGQYLGLCPFHGEKTPSFRVYTRGRPHFHCFGCSANGDAVGFVQLREGLKWREAILFLAHALGLSPDAVDTEAAKERRAKAEERRRVNDARRFEREQREAEATAAWCLDRWKESLAAARTPVEQYLRGRAITMEIPASIRFHPELRHKDLKRKLPCMVAPIQDVLGNVTGLHRTFLGLYAGGWEKLREGQAKLVAGKKRGGRIRLCPVAPHMGDAEGIESGLSVIQETGLPTWAAVDLGNLDAPFPDLVTRVTQLCDNDEKKPEEAERLRRRACRAHQQRGLAVTQARPPKGMDFNDVLRANAQVAA